MSIEHDKFCRQSSTRLWDNEINECWSSECECACNCAAIEMIRADERGQAARRIHAIEIPPPRNTLSTRWFLEQALYAVTSKGGTSC